MLRITKKTQINLVQCGRFKKLTPQKALAKQLGQMVGQMENYPFKDKTSENTLIS